MVTTPVGEYYLRGVMETACGFRLEKDSSFQFFFSQGALDRTGQGTWSMKNYQVVLNSKTRPPHDFALVTSSKKPGKDIEIRITDPNSHILRYVYCGVSGGGKNQEAMAGQDGVFRFKSQSIDSIQLIFEFCPEKVSTFKLPASDHNYFEFKFEPWLFEIFFSDFKLQVAGEDLNGGNPVLQGNNFVYERRGE